MSDLICRKSMTRCQTPGMCSPHGGCPSTETVSSAWLAQLRGEFLAVGAERDRLKAQLDVALSGMKAAVDTANWQATTNQELNQHAETNRQLRAENERLTNNRDMWKAQSERQAQDLAGLSQLRADDAPYLFSLTPDLSACCLDIKGEPYHFTADEAFDAFRKDAERYRWLRLDDVEQCRISRKFSEEQMDAAIDAAIGKEASHANEA